ncbi:hypothetical protein ACFL1E_04335 [Candidatus Omnitrophota bacterium]
MNKVSKRIIAREWLVLLGFVIAAIVLRWWTSSPNAVLVLLWVYPAYLLIRITIWAIKSILIKGE